MIPAIYQKIFTDTGKAVWEEDEKLHKITQQHLYEEKMHREKAEARLRQEEERRKELQACLEEEKRRQLTTVQLTANVSFVLKCTRSK